MFINIERVEITFDEQELNSIFWALKSSLKSKAEHCNKHDGIKTFEKNNSQEINLFMKFGRMLNLTNVFPNVRNQFDDKEGYEDNYNWYNQY